MAKVRRTASEGREELDQLWARHNSLMMFASLSAQTLVGAIANGTTAGKLKTLGTVPFRIGRGAYSKAATDDLWDLTGPTDLAAGEYQAHWLFLDAAGTASIGSGGVRASAAEALKALPVLDGTKSVIGVFVAGPSTDYDAALSAQGTIHNGIPDGVPCGVPRQTYAIPTWLDLVPA